MAVFDFKDVEKRILQFWEEHKIFQKSLELRKKAKRFVFFEGPPTANGRPGIHHFVGRAFKDVFNRYKTMQGFYVLRKAGWDTHGLPVELEVEKQLGFKNKKDIEEYGIAKFNRKCRESVWKYKQEWEAMTRRMGFWVDLENPYITYETPYMESIWAILKKIWDKRLLYQAHKVVPFCTRCGTPLSSHEVAQGYTTVTDKSVTVKFLISKSEFLNKLQIPKNSNTYILAWTTTPWTLPGNVALAVGKDITYVVVKSYKNYYIVAKDLVEKVISGEFTIEKELKGSELVGLEYEPLFDIKKLKSENSYKIHLADFVSTSEGTGVVHTAVMYGEDDYNMGTMLNLPKVHTVTEQGKFEGVSDELDGLYVKDKKTEELIIRQLEIRNLLLKVEDFEHEYPFCWRCHTALLYYAKTSWFIKMSEVKEQLIKNNQQINWIPEHIKEGRFGQWIKEGKDWAISRERYWGTPLPIWKCARCDALKMTGSIADLEKSAVGSGNTYIIMRHGSSGRMEGEDTIIGSRLDIDKYHLTTEGKEQVHKSVERISGLHEEADLIFASPFLRTKETAQIAGRLFHKTIKYDERLGEIRHDQNCEGRSHKLCPADDKPWDFDKKDDHGNGTGESYNDVRRRLSDFINELELKYKGKKILIVTHGAPLWMLSVMARGLTAEQAQPEYSGPWLLALAGFQVLKWRNIPRNDIGELDLHRPFVDAITVKCNKCGAQMKRIPDLIDVWFDSGAMPYAQWHWPFENAKLFKEQFPADFITEAIDQTLGWFYTLLAVATLLDMGPVYKNVLCYSHVLDEKGQKMSKSKGNIVLPGDVMDKFGVDTARWFFYTINSPGDSKLYSEKDLKERLTGFMGTLQNCVRFYELYAVSDKGGPNAHGNIKPSSKLDQWIISRLHNLIASVTVYMDAYDTLSASRTIERFVVDDFSKWWLRLSRKRPEALPLLRAVLLELSKVLAPFVPYTAEDIHTRLHAGRKGGTESVHLHDWPRANRKAIDIKLEEEMLGVQKIVTEGLALRKEKQIKVRQPLASLTVSGKKLEEGLEGLIKEEVNVKKVLYTKEGPLVLDIGMTPELKAEGYAREFMRQLQDMRKDAGYHIDHKAYCQWFSQDTELSAAIFHFEDEIKRDTVLVSLIKSEHDKKAYDIEKEFEIFSGPSAGQAGKKIWIGIRKQ